MKPAIKILFLDIGGVLLSDAWDRHARRRAASKFHLEMSEIEERHHLMFETYEDGKITLDEYLEHLVFYRKRPFTRAQFRRFIFDQSKPYPEMIDLIARLKDRYGIRVAIVSNEAREINAYRIRQFKLVNVADFFISSCFVHIRKPDADIFRLALDVAQVSPQEVIYIDNTPMFVSVAERLGIKSVLHKDYETTCTKLASIGLET